MLVARVLRLIGAGVFLLLAVGVLLVALDLERSGPVAEPVVDAGRYLAEPFRDVVDLEQGREHLQIAIVWGIAGAVYLVIALVLAAIVARLVRAGKGRREKRSKAAAEETAATSGKGSRDGKAPRTNDAAAAGSASDPRDERPAAAREGSGASSSGDGRAGGDRSADAAGDPPTRVSGADGPPAEGRSTSPGDGERR